MIDIFDISGSKITSSDVLKDLLVTKDCQHIEELMKANYVKLSWEDTKRYELPVGAYIIPFPNETNPFIPNDTRYPIKYKLFSPYVPEAKNTADYEYEPEFQHPIMWLANLPLMFITGNITSWADALKKTTWGYTGSATQIAAFIVNCINWIAAHDTAFGNTFGTGWVAMVDTNLAPNATVTFDSVDIMSGASAIAQAFDCEFHFDFARKQFRLGEIRYGTEVTLQTDVNVGVASVSRTKTDYHNAFIIKGGTKNLSQPTDTGENLQLTERLTLDPTMYPDSTIYTDNAGNIVTREQFLALGVPALMEELIFDDVYPKLDLYLYNVRERKCWLLDENGHKVEDPNGELDPTDNKRYKAYSKWYTRLAYPIYTVDAQGNRTISSWADYHATQDKIIEGQTLQITFLPNLESGAMTSLLIGQGDFDAVYFSEQTHEWEEDDIDPNGFTAEAGDYRIVQKEVSGLIIPTTSSGGIYPQGTQTPAITNNKSTLLNIVVDDTYKVEARQDLEMVAKRKVSLLRSDLNNYNLPSNPVYFEANNTKLHIGQAVIYNDGQTTPYTLSTHVLKIVTQLDYSFVQEITVGNQKVKGDISTMKEQIQTILSGGVGGSGSIDERQITTLIQTIGSQYFLSKVANDTAKGEITFEQILTMLKGLQVGANFVPDILGEGGVLRMNNDGKVELVVDTLYARMRAYFDSVVIREYRHESGNRIKSPAQGFNASRVEYIKVVSGTETIVEDASEADFFRCYWRVDDGEKKAENQFVIGDLAFCEHSDVVNGSLVTKRYWRVVTGRNSGNTTTADGEAWIDLSNAHNASGNPVMTTITYTGQGGTTQTKSVLSFESGSDVPEAHDDICMLGCVTDNTRQGAIIEYVSGTNAPSYQIYQSIGSDATNPYVLTNKNQITIGYNSATGKADMKVYGDAYIGARDRSTFIEFKQDDGTEQHNPALNIKAHVEFTNSNQELDAFVQSHQRDDSYDDTEVRGLIDGLQDQIDGQIESWFYNYAPVAVDSQGAPTSKVPSNVEPYKSWNDADVAAGNDVQKIAHLGDTFTNNTTGYCWRFSRNSTTNAFEWVIIEDSAVITALQNAARAQDTADHKRRVFLSQPVPPYDAGDMWVNAVYPANYTGVTDEANHNYNNDILKCVTAKASDGSFSINDWALASKYTDDSKFNGYISALLNNTGLSGDSAAAAVQNAILGALGVGTVVAGGLLLTSLIGMRQYNGSGDKTDVANYTTWAGISGQYNANVLGGGMAAWYGGGMLDKETLTTQQIAQGWSTLRWAKGVDRFDGSGYRADGNISWNANGALTIKNITTLSDSNNNNILNELATFNSAFTFGTSGQGSTTALYITPQVPFQSLYIGTSNADKQEVATKNWVNQNFVTTTFFDNLFRVYNGSESSANKIAVNGTLPSDTANLNIEAMFGFWTKKYISALGQGDDGSTSYTTLAQLNDVSLSNPTANQVLSYNGTHWVNRSIELGSQTLSDLTDVVITSPAANQMLGYDATTQKWKNIAIPATGVTSVALSMPTGFSITGSPITASGTFTVAFASGYSLPTTAKQSNWDTAYGWGDHADVGYALAANLGTASSHAHSDYLTSLSWDSTNNKLAWSKGGTAQTAITIGYASVAGSANSVAWSAVTGTPTTLGDYGITDAKIANGVITIGGNTITPLTSHQTLYTLSVYGGTTKVLDFKPNANASLYIKAGGDISLTNDTTNKYITLSYSHPTNGANTTINAANGRVLSAITVNSLGHVTSVSYKALSAADIPDLSSTYSTSTRVSTLEGYFTNGVANSAAKLTTVSKTAWGQTFWTSGGVPTSISGSLSSVTNITMSGYIKIGDAILKWDSANNALKLYKLSGSSEVAVNFYATGGVSALGMSEDGSAGAGDVTWVLLADGTDTRQIALSHLTTSLTTITGGTTDATNKRYAVYKNSSNQLFVDVPWTAGSGTVTSVKVGTTSYTPTNGVISLPAYPTDTNTWRGIYVKGTSSIGTANTTKALNFAAGSNVSLSFAAAGTGSGQSGNANYGTITISATDTTYESKAAASGGTAVSLVTTGEKYTWNSKAAGDHTHTTTIATSTGTNQLTLAFGSKYAITAGGTSYVFTMPSNPNTNTTYKFTIGSTTKGDATNGVDLGTLKSETAAASGTTLSLVTTGEKYSWNNKTYTTSIAADSGTNQLTLAFGTKYKLTAGGTSFVFTMPANPDTDIKVKVNNTNPTTGTWYYPVWYTATNGTGEVNANDGFRYYSLQGTASALGESYLQIGNSTASGTAGNKRGHLRIYGNKAYYGEFNMIDNLSDNKTYTFDTAGTILTSGNSSVTKSGQTLTVTINGTALSLTNSTYTLAGLMGSSAKGSTTQPIYWTGSAFANTSYTLGKSVPSDAVFTDHYAWSDITGKPSSFTPSAHNHSQIVTEGDNRSTNTTPNNYVNTLVFRGLKTNTAIGSPYSDSYSYLVGLRGWADSSGGNAHELAFNTNGIYRRQGDTTSWGNWYHILDSGNSSVSKNGETLTVKINGTSQSLTNTNTTYSASTGLSLSGTAFSINSTYQTYISHGESAYGWGNHANAGYASASSLSNYLKDPKTEPNGITVSDSYYLYNDSAETGFGFNRGTKTRFLIGSYDDKGYIYNSFSGTSYYIFFKDSGIQLPNVNGTYIQLGDIRIVYDSANNALKVVKSDGTSAANLYATGGVSALGAGQESGGGGGDVTWALLASPATGGRTIHSSYISSALSNYLPLTGGTITGMLRVIYESDPYSGAETFKALAYAQAPYGIIFRGYASGVHSIQVQRENDSNETFGLALNPLGGNVSVGNVSPSYKLHVSGVVGATGFTNTSDIRKKNVIKDTDLRIEQIAKAPSFEYYWLDQSIDHDLHVGTSAQYWQSVLPEVVSRAKDEMGTLSMQYGVAALISAITVARKVMTHEEKIALLETRVSALEKENGEQEQLINSLQEELAKFKAA